MLLNNFFASDPDETTLLSAGKRGREKVGKRPGMGWRHETGHAQKRLSRRLRTDWDGRHTISDTRRGVIHERE